MAKQRFHIYQLSRLAFAQVTDWDRILADLEAGRNQMFWSYKPVRLGAFSLLTAAGSDDVQKIYTSVSALAEKAGGARCQAANLNALKTFESRFLPSIASPQDNYMESAVPGVEFADIELIGGHHFRVLDKRVRNKFAYLHPSNWKDEQTEAFCELLTVIIEERFHATADAIWFLDLRRGKRVPWSKSKPRVRRKCERAARLLARLRSANLEDESD